MNLFFFKYCAVTLRYFVTNLHQKLHLTFKIRMETTNRNTAQDTIRSQYPIVSSSVNQNGTERKKCSIANKLERRVVRFHATKQKQLTA